MFSRNFYLFIGNLKHSMARLRNEKAQPIWFHYIGNKGRNKVLIPSKGTVDVDDFVRPNGEINSEWITIMSDFAVKMMDAERDAISYINKES